jgi:beta-galactosidase
VVSVRKFRDVYLVPFFESSIIDYRVTTDMYDSFDSGTIRVNTTIQGDRSDMELSLRLLSPDGAELDDCLSVSSDVYEIQLQSKGFELSSVQTPRHIASNPRDRPER